MTLEKEPYENTVGGENACNPHFLPLPHGFLPWKKGENVLKKAYFLWWYKVLC